MPETVIRTTVLRPAGSPGGRNNWFNFDRLSEGFRWLLIVGFSCLVAYATYDGLYQLIAANIVNGKPPPAVHLLIGVSSSLLVLTIIYTLQRMRAERIFWRRVSWFAAYFVLVLLSIGIGFGFYWKYLNSSDVELREQRDALLQVGDTLDSASQQVATLLSATAALKNTSQAKAQEEMAHGHTCDEKGAGNGPRTALRQNDAAEADELNTFVRDNGGFVAADVERLKNDLASISKLEPAAQAQRTVQLNNEIKQITDRYNRFRTQPRLKQMRDRAQRRLETKAWFDTNRAIFTCPDPALESDLRRVINAVDVLSATTLNPPQIKEVQESRATLEAFKRLAGSIWSILPAKSSIGQAFAVSRWFANDARPPASAAPDQARPAQVEARPAQVEAVPTLESGDIPALVVAAFVDFCLFIVTRRPRGLLENSPRTRALSLALRTLNRTIDADTLFNDYVFSALRTYYIFAPKGVPLGAPNAPDRPQRRQDRLMALAFAALDRADIGLIEKVRFPWWLRPQEKLIHRGRIYLKGHNEFDVYRLAPGALQEMIGALVLNPEEPIAPTEREATVAVDPRTRRRDQGGMRETRLNGPRGPATSDPIEEAGPSEDMPPDAASPAATPPTAPPPRKKPPGRPF
jgi:hypothetical protein